VLFNSKSDKFYFTNTEFLQINYLIINY